MEQVRRMIVLRDETFLNERVLAVNSQFAQGVPIKS
jgi:hypothetical protein